MPVKHIINTWRRSTNDRLFLDTNIVVDVLERREPYCREAVQLFTMAYNKQVQLIVSPMTYSTASFLLRKHGPDGVRNLLSNFRQLSRVATTNERTVDDSLASQFKDFEDALQYYTALKAKADVIITRNGKDFSASKLPVMTAKDFLATSDYR